MKLHKWLVQRGKEPIFDTSIRHKRGVIEIVQSGGLCNAENLISLITPAGRFRYVGLAHHSLQSASVCTKEYARIGYCLLASLLFVYLFVLINFL